MMEDGVMAKHGAVEHWAKIEVPSRTTDLMLIRERLSARYPLERFTAVRCGPECGSEVLTLRAHQKYTV